MLSHTAEYALRGCIELARRGGAGPVTVGVIARALDVPGNYLSKIFHELGRTGLVESTRGPCGGFELARRPEQIHLDEIVAHFQPELVGEEGRCILGRGSSGDGRPCAAHGRWKDVAAGIKSFLEGTTLADLAVAADGAGSEDPRAVNSDDPDSEGGERR